MKVNINFQPYTISLISSQNKHFPDKSCRKTRNTYFIFETTWKNVVQRRMPQITIRRIAWWIPKATNTHTQVVYYSLLFHCNNGCKNASQVIHTLSVLYLIPTLKVWMH